MSEEEKKRIIELLRLSHGIYTDFINYLNVKNNGGEYLEFEKMILNDLYYEYMVWFNEFKRVYN